MSTKFYTVGKKLELRDLHDGFRKLHSHTVIVSYLEEWQQKNGTLSEDEIREFHILFHRLLWHGKAKFSVRLMEFMYRSHKRKRFMRCLKQCPYIVQVEPPCSIEGQERCTTYGLRGVPGLVKCVDSKEHEVGAPTQTDLPWVGPCWRVDGSCCAFISVAGSWLKLRTDTWLAFCVTFGYPVGYDPYGVTFYGEALFHACDSVRLPTVIDWSSFPGSEGSLLWSQRWVRAFRSGSLRRLCVRIWGRVYHPLVNVPKWVRRRLKILHEGVWEDVAEVDLSATYWVLLASMLPPCAERDGLVEVLSGVGGRDFYRELMAACFVSYPSRDAAKAEVQKQCLFWKVWRHMDEGSRPLWFALRRRFPRLASMIDSMRSRLSGSRLSEVLTRAEASFFVDRMLPMVHKMGIPVMTIHDCLVVPVSVAQRILGLCQQEALDAFGFVPRFSVVS